MLTRQQRIRSLLAPAHNITVKTVCPFPYTSLSLLWQGMKQLSFRDNKIFLDITSVFADIFAFYLNNKQLYLSGISPKFKKKKVDQEKDQVPAVETQKQPSVVLGMGVGLAPAEHQGCACLSRRLRSQEDEWVRQRTVCHKRMETHSNLWFLLLKFFLEN